LADLCLVQRFPHYNIIIRAQRCCSKTRSQRINRFARNGACKTLEESYSVGQFSQTAYLSWTANNCTWPFSCLSFNTYWAWALGRGI